MPVQAEAVKSKVCIKECKASEDRTYCVGCGRTIEEIIACGRNAKETNEDIKGSSRG